MLTPTQLKAIQFSKSMFGGYNAHEVDKLLDELTVDYEQLYTGNAELTKKVEKLLDRIEVFEEQEESLKAAIINAQRMCDNIVKQARQEAELIEIDARAKGDKLIDSMTEAVKQKREELDGLQKEAGDFRERLVALYRQHLSLITALPVYEEQPQQQIEQGGPRVHSGQDGASETPEYEQGVIQEQESGGRGESEGDSPDDTADSGAEDYNTGDTVVFERPVTPERHEPSDGAIPPPVTQPPARPVAEVIDFIAEDEHEGYDEITHIEFEDSLQFGPAFDIETGKKRK